MNLIVSRQLGQAERQLIDELTLKKRQSKKSTMSEKQRRARQQLAKELEQERRSPPLTFTCYAPEATRTSSSASCLPESSIDTGINMTINLSAVSVSQASSSGCSSGGGVGVGAGIGGGSCGCSFSRSDSSYSGSSQDSGMMLTMSSSQASFPRTNQQHQDGVTPANAAKIDTSRDDQNTTITTTLLDATQKCNDTTHMDEEARMKEADIRFHRGKLEHLNEELERRLYQYEYLLAQEKALLGTHYNFISGVNNFQHQYQHLE